ncbi:hypothetical protein B6R25_25255 [Escherichia coli]|nr:hypothetical protein RG56_26210 [Escherichia coli]APL16525.1 hypothetical protein RG58_26165 [Escherichia coli]APL26048.1 hypothetical protein RG60_25250 [Escherichia coli]APL31039.1 hypothetical protein RG61_25330 [Escherichia coli]APL41005.1 hypothetical protein RG63_25835 [Escherichia coli]
MLIAQVMIKNGIPTKHSNTLIILIMNIVIREASGEGFTILWWVSFVSLNFLGLLVVYGLYD